MENKQQNLKARDLRQVNLDQSFKDEVFPTRVKGMNETLELICDDEVACYICMDTIPGELTAIHVYIVPEQRSYDNIMLYKKLFYELLHPWCKERGYTQILFSCAGKDKKTTDLGITFGFKPVNLNMALMPVQ